MLGKGIKPCAAAERTEVAHRAADSRMAHAFYRLTTVTANLRGEAVRGAALWSASALFVQQGRT